MPVDREWLGRSLRDALLDALAVVLPICCAGCGADDRGLCSACRLDLVPRLQTRTLEDGTCVTSALGYGGPARRAILAFKESGRTDLARALARPLAVAIAAAIPPRLLDGPSQVELCPVPTGRAAYRRRGYDPVALLVRKSGLRASPVLMQVRAHGAQKRLGRLERGTNLVGSMRSRGGPLSRRTFVVIDDVVTTGATILEAARAIRSAGGDVVAAATLAFTPKMFPQIRVPSQKA